MKQPPSLEKLVLLSLCESYPMCLANLTLPMRAKLTYVYHRELNKCINGQASSLVPRKRRLIQLDAPFDVHRAFHNKYKRTVFFASTSCETLLVEYNHGPVIYDDFPHFSNLYHSNTTSPFMRVYHGIRNRTETAGIVPQSRFKRIRLNTKYKFIHREIHPSVYVIKYDSPCEGYEQISVKTIKECRAFFDSLV